jgi:hypothetical protein
MMEAILMLLCFCAIFGYIDEPDTRPKQQQRRHYEGDF